MSIGTAIQIGLHKSLELDSLATTGYREVEHDINASHAFDWEFIKMFGFDCFHVWGIDADPESVWQMTKEYEFIDTIQIVNAHIAGQSGILKNTVIGLDYSASEPHDRILIPSVSLEDLFACLKADSVDILFIDVDGAEWEIFENYSWDIQPTHIISEVTEIGGKTKTDFIDLLSDAGYVPYFEASLETSPPSYNIQFERKKDE